MDKKRKQLGMHPSTAAHRLRTDIMYSLAEKLNLLFCYRCGDSISREEFSIEHKEDWLDSHNPIGIYFDLDNIAFSHKSCNYQASKEKRTIRGCGTASSYHRGCRCEACKEAKHKEYLRTKKQ